MHYLSFIFALALIGCASKSVETSNNEKSSRKTASAEMDLYCVDKDLDDPYSYALSLNSKDGYFTDLIASQLTDSTLRTGLYVDKWSKSGDQLKLDLKPQKGDAWQMRLDLLEIRKTSSRRLRYLEAGLSESVYMEKYFLVAGEVREPGRASRNVYCYVKKDAVK